MKGRPVGTTKLRPEFRRAFIALYRDPGFPVAALQERFGFSEATVYVTARRLKLPTRAAIKRARGLPSHGPVPDEVPMSPDALQLALFPDPRARRRETQRVWVQRKRAAHPKPRVGGNTAGHRERCAGRSARQLARLEVALAAQRLAETPRWRACEVCGYREDTTQPHAHKEAA